MFSRVAALFHDLDAGMLPISVLFPYAPIAPHRARDAARAELARVFATVIAARRAAAAEGGAPPEDDILQSFIDARYSPAVHGGRALTDGEITGLLIACLFAGQHTSSITSAWTGYLMLTHRPAALEPAIAEQARLLATHGDTLDIGVLGEMEALQANITEAIRLFPPLIMLLRLAKKPFAVSTSAGQTFTVPAGDMVFASPAFSHRLPHVFPNADAYEPARFGPDRAEDKKGEPFSFIGFGGGRCVFFFLSRRERTEGRGDGHTPLFLLLSFCAPLAFALILPPLPPPPLSLLLPVTAAWAPTSPTTRSRPSGRSSCASLNWKWWTRSPNRITTRWWSAPSPGGCGTGGASWRRRRRRRERESCV